MMKYWIIDLNNHRLMLLLVLNHWYFFQLLTQKWFFSLFLEKIKIDYKLYRLRILQCLHLLPPYLLLILHHHHFSLRHRFIVHRIQYCCLDWRLHLQVYLLTLLPFLLFILQIFQMHQNLHPNLMVYPFIIIVVVILYQTRHEID